MTRVNNRINIFSLLPLRFWVPVWLRNKELDSWPWAIGFESAVSVFREGFHRQGISGLQIGTR